MLFINPILGVAQAVALTGLNVARAPYDLMMSARPTIVEVKIGLIGVSENVAARCIRELRLSYLSAPASTNFKLKLELVDKDFLVHFPVSHSDMFAVTRKLRKNILLDVGSWLNCEKSHVKSDRVTMIFAPKIPPLSLTA